MQRIFTIATAKIGDRNEALQSAFAFQKTATEQDSAPDIALAYACIGTALWQLDRYEESMPYLEQSAELSKKVSPELAARAQNTLLIAKEGLQALVRSKTSQSQPKIKLDVPQPGLSVEQAQRQLMPVLSTSPQTADAPAMQQIQSVQE